MATGFPTKANWATGDVLTASAMDDLAGTVNLLNPVAKGGLVAGSGANTTAVLSVGTDGSTLVANSASATGMAWAGPSVAGGKNAIINGGFDIWQRGTSQSAGTSGYQTADRYYLNNAGATGFTFNQGASDLTGFRYFGRLQRASGNAGTTGMTVGYTLETSESLRFAGQTVTFSFYARKGANYSMGNFPVTLYYGTGTDQRLYSFTGLTAVATSPNFSPTTSWARYSQTVTIPSNATELGFEALLTPTGTAGAADYIDLTGFQLELGSVATTFSRAGGTLQGELAACQRYYWRSSTPNAYCVQGWGTATTTSNAQIQIPLPSSMRIPPSTIEWSGLLIADGVGSSTPSAVTNNSYNTSFISLNVTASSLTVYRPYFFINGGSTTGYIGIGAEL